MSTNSLARARYIAVRTLELLRGQPPCPRCNGDATREHTATGEWCVIVTEAQRRAEREWGTL